MNVVYTGMPLQQFGMCGNQNKPATICSAAISGDNILKTTNKTHYRKNPSYCRLCAQFWKRYTLLKNLLKNPNEQLLAAAKTALWKIFHPKHVLDPLEGSTFGRQFSEPPFTKSWCRPGRAHVLSSMYLFQT